MKKRGRKRATEGSDRKQEGQITRGFYWQIESKRERER